MGLQSFERGLERMVDGVFTRAFKGNVRPIELGRRLLREMDDNRSVDLKGRRIGISSQMKEPARGESKAALVLPSGERLPLADKVVSFGRHPECTVVVNDSNVSRRHAEIRPTGRGYSLTDLGSTNGTKVNGIGINGERALSD